MKIAWVRLVPVIAVLLIIQLLIPLTTTPYHKYFPTTTRNENVAYSPGIIVIDYSHGQNMSSFTYENDILLDSELTALGYTVIWATGGLNYSILDGVQGLIIGSIAYEDNCFKDYEVLAISNWFNSGSNFLWVGCDSDYTSLPTYGQFINDNMSLILQSVGSHVYPEPTSIEDPVSCISSAYRVLANETSNDPFVAEIVEGVQTVLFHGPTCLYGSNNTLNPGVGIDPIALEGNSINDVYPVLYYGANATIYDSDGQDPIVHENGESGKFVATTIEVNAGAAESGVIVVSGASPYGDYRSMNFDDYFDVHMNGSLFVTNLIRFGINSQPSKLFQGTIVFDYAHVEHHGVFNYENDFSLTIRLEAMGYNVIWATGVLTHQSLLKQMHLS